ncbi:hypothetical protein ACXN5S_12555 [Pseudoroseicyclus sp. H15]
MTKTPKKPARRTLPTEGGSYRVEGGKAALVARTEPAQKKPDQAAAPASADEKKEG